MHTLLQIGLTNAVAAALLAAGVFAVSRCCRRPALLHGLWLLVLVKLLTPPLFALPVAGLAAVGAAFVGEAEKPPPVTDSLPPVAREAPAAREQTSARADDIQVMLPEPD